MIRRNRHDEDRARDIAALEAAKAEEREAAERWPRIRALTEALAELRAENNFSARLKEAFKT